MNQNPLSEDELDRLEVLLEHEMLGGEAMRLDEIQAMLCAVISGPEMVPPSVWLLEAIGNLPQEKYPAETAELLDLLMRFNNEIARALMDNETVATILYPLEESGDEYDYAAWADAYIFGTGLGSDWFEAAGKHAEDLSELIEPMFMLNGMLREDAEKSGERWFTPTEEARLLADIQESLPAITQAIYNFWLSKRQTTTVRHEEPKAGRNDPCPCGSGKKFKQCCGAPEKLH